MTEEVKPIKPVTLNMPKPELKPLDKTPLTKCELCLHFVRRVDNEHVFCMMYGETPHVTASDYCEKFTPMDRNPVLAHIYRSLLDAETDEAVGLRDAVNTAISMIEKELKEAGLCRELSINPDMWSDDFSTCIVTVKCNYTEYKVWIAIRARAKIDYVERVE